MISWVIVEPCIGTLKRSLRARSTPFWIATGHLVGLAVAHADLRLLVADHHERGEGEAPAALDDLGDAVDLHHALLHVLPGAVPWAAASSCPVSRSHFS